ncbi:hypothetical protein BGZ83_010643 [Gryganskiella cystojenkinii]|nr:hypothetical protein BGZ83_010643 [Gryganskiella cystojenkinii]
MSMDINWIPDRSPNGLSEDNQGRQQLRDARMALLPEEDKGVVYWQDYCEEHGWEGLPTRERILEYTVDFVLPMESAFNERARQDPSINPISGTKVFIEPVLRLLDRMRRTLATPSPSPFPVDIPTSTPTTTATAAATGTITIPAAVTTPTTVKAPSVATAPTPDQAIKEEEEFKSAQATEQSRSNLETHEKDAESGSENEESDTSEHQFSDWSLDDEFMDADNESDGFSNDEDDHDGGGDDDVKDAETSNTTEISHPADAEIDSFDFKAGEFQWIVYLFNRKGKVLPEAPIHKLDSEVKTVLDVLQEWRYGFKGSPAIQDLNNQHGSRWRDPCDKTVYETRLGIVKEYMHLVLFKGYSDRAAVSILQEIQGDDDLEMLFKRIREPHLVEKNPKPKTPVHPPTVDGGAGQVVRRRRRTQRKPVMTQEEIERIRELRRQVPFPFPIRDLFTIRDIWTEWMVGWEGAPSIESLITKYTKLWIGEKERTEQYTHFYYRDRIVQSIRLAVAKGAVGTVEDAIDILEKAKRNLSVSTFNGSKEFEEIRAAWGTDIRKRHERKNLTKKTKKRKVVKSFPPAYVVGRF